LGTVNIYVQKVRMYYGSGTVVRIASGQPVDAEHHVQQRCACNHQMAALFCIPRISC